MLSNNVSKNDLSRFDTSLWREYLNIAQSYWMPKELHSIKLFSVLIGLLAYFVASLVFISILAIAKFANLIVPEFVAIAGPGLIKWVDGLIASPVSYIFYAGIIIPTFIFGTLSKRLAKFIRPWAMLGGLLLLSFSVSGLSVVMSYVGRFFQTSLAKKDIPSFWNYLYIYASVFVMATPIVVVYSYARKKLGMFWREWISNSFVDSYMDNRAYYELNANKSVDNPDQRISEDLKSFTVTSLDFLLIILGAVIDLIAFMGILWSISKFLSGVLLVYAVFGTAVTILIGKRLVGINYNQLKKEADFRYGLVHIRDHSESIAFYQGEKKEKEEVKTRLKSALDNFNELIGWQRNLDFFTTGYNYVIRILPAAIVAPMYFKGDIEFGQISQASMAFAHVLMSFSIIVRYFDSISAFAAGINRVSSFKTTLSSIGDSPEGGPQVARMSQPTIKLEDFSLQTPDYSRTLIKNLDFNLEDSGSVLIVGHSGVGKSSLLRGIAGLWRSGTGVVAHPDLKDVMFLPQRPYMVLGSLRDQFHYPSALDVSDEQISDALDVVNLKEVFDKMREATPEGESVLDSVQTWDKVFSQGEQQRLAFARILISKPKFVILDEATSALDVDNEKRLYSKLDKLGIQYISVGHRPTLKEYHSTVLEIKGEGEWDLHKASNYQF